MRDMLNIVPDIQSALAADTGVVALETSVVAQGLPWPHNMEAFRRCEAAVRSCHAVPATIAIQGGRARVGMTEAETMALAAGHPAKLSCSDLGCAVGLLQDGATTVSGTVAIAALAGIRVMATGGIGGVHRGAEDTFDVSADLDELARQPVAVVCCGAKAILDLPKTLERLESLGVPVVGYRTDVFPAFYHKDSGLRLLWHADDPMALARILTAHWDGMRRISGVLIVQAPPRDLDATKVDLAVSRALAESVADGVTGKAVTPFLLGRVSALTDGESIDVNLALLEENARLAGLVAVALASARKERS